MTPRVIRDTPWWITTNLLIGKKVAGPYPSKAVAEAFREMNPAGEKLFSATEGWPWPAPKLAQEVLDFGSRPSPGGTR